MDYVRFLQVWIGLLLVGTLGILYVSIQWPEDRGVWIILVVMGISLSATILELKKFRGKYSYKGDQND